MLNKFHLGNNLYKPTTLVKATQGVGIPLLDSGKKPPAPSINLQPTAPKLDLLLANCNTFSKVSSATTVSGFKIQTYSPLASARAILFPLGKPKFSLFAINFIFGKRVCIISQLPSDELLSITIISASKFKILFRTLLTQSSKK